MIISVGIPVFNARNFLPATVNSVISEAYSIQDEIELVIVDNCSTDGTADYLHDLLEKTELPRNLKLKVFFNSKNMGLDFSIYKIIEESSGDYLWFLGAQELIRPNALQKILTSISKNPWQIVLNFEVFNEVSQKVIWENSFNKYHDFSTNNVVDFFEEIGGPALSISANITRRSSLLIMSKKPTISSYWGWLEHLLDVAVDPERDGNLIFISEPSIRVMIESDGWQNRNQKETGFPMYFTSIELSEIALLKFENYPRIRNTIGVFRTPFGCVPTILRAKVQGLKVNKETLRRSTIAYGFTPWYWFIGLPLLLLPPKFVSKKVLEIATQSIRSVRNFKSFVSEKKTK